MNDEIIYRWHPKFNVYHIDDNVLLLSEQEQLLLPYRQFPLMEHVDGVKTVGQITSQTRRAAKQAGFLNYCEQLNQQGVLLAQSDHHWKQGYSNQVDTWTATVRSLSSCSAYYIQQWLDILEQADPNIAYILVDDFFDPRVLSTTAQFDYTMVIKISGEKLWFGPVLAQHENDLLARLIQQLLDNVPVLKMLLQLFPEQNHALSYRELSLDQGAILRAIVSQQNAANKMLLIIDSPSQRLTRHKINEYYRPLDFARQLNSPIQLQSCSVEFNQDGGSRHVTPEQTVARLASLVDNVTGPIAYLDELDAAKGRPVKIFKSGFYKMPSMQPTLFDLIQPCLGKGVSSVQSQASALGEALERLAAQYRGDEPYITSRRSELEKPSYDYQTLTPYSDVQYQAFANQNSKESKRKQAAIPYQDERIHWLSCYSLSQERQVYIPFTCGFANTPFEQECFGRWQSNGSAAGNTLEEAIIQGLFELIERDAIAIWWYNRIKRPAFELNKLNAQYFKALSKTLSKEQKFWVLDLTCDIGVPVMAAIGQNKVNGKLSFGFGCHLQSELAAQRALTELCQLTPIREQNSASFDFNAIKDDDYLHPCNNAEAIKPFATTTMDIKQDILNMVGQLAKLDLETLALDYSRAHLPIHTAKVIVPGLCHIWPQLANQRLYQVPVKLGWLDTANLETTINPQALYI